MWRTEQRKKDNATSVLLRDNIRFRTQTFYSVANVYWFQQVCKNVIANVSFEYLAFLGVSFREYVDQMFHIAYNQELNLLNIWTESSSDVPLTSSSDLALRVGRMMIKKKKKKGEERWLTVGTVTYQQGPPKTVNFQVTNFRKENHESFTHRAADYLVFIEQTDLGGKKWVKETAKMEREKKNTSLPRKGKERKGKMWLYYPEVIPEEEAYQEHGQAGQTVYSLTAVSHWVWHRRWGRRIRQR